MCRERLSQDAPCQCSQAICPQKALCDRGSGESSDVLALVVVGRVEHLRRHICKPEAEGQGKTGVGHPNCSVGHDWPLTLFPAHDPVHE
jgi:hypothetical protein